MKEIRLVMTIVGTIFLLVITILITVNAINWANSMLAM